MVGTKLFCHLFVSLPCDRIIAHFSHIGLRESGDISVHTKHKKISIGGHQAVLHLKHVIEIIAWAQEHF